MTALAPPELDLSVFTAMQVDLSATVPCIVEACPTEACWRGLLRHSGDGSVCGTAVFCGPHRDEVDEAAYRNFAVFASIARAFGAGVESRCIPHDRPCVDDPLVEWTAL